jgi:RNA polymerase sigma factor (sigma-70 family)
MSDSIQLLGQYIKEGSEQAFAQLVTQHIDLVFSTAVRRLGGDTDLAQDLVQIVFTDLARKAGRLPQEVVLAGWLYRHTCFTASKMIRGNRRREAREKKVVEMNALNENPDPSWEQVAPFLDEAMQHLGACERDAIVLRYFERHDLHAVGAALGMTEEAARKRVTRALEKLRGYFARRHVTLSASALGSMLALQAVTSAPAGLALGVAGPATAAAVAASGAALTFFKIMTITRFKLVVGGAILATSMAIPLIVQHQTIQRLQRENSALRFPLAELEQLQTDNQRLGKLETDAQELERLRKNQIELMRLRGEIGALRRATNELTKLKPEQQKEDDIANVGTRSPHTALQTILWAARNGDSNLVSQLLGWRKDETISDEDADLITRAQTGSFLMTFSNLSGIRIVAMARDAEGTRSRMRVEFAEDNGKTHLGEIEVAREGEEWKPLFNISQRGSSFLLPLTPELGPTNRLGY